MGMMDAATTFTANRRQAVLVHFHDSNVTEPATWHALAVPYLIEPNITITAPVTVEPGAELRFTAHLFVSVEGDGSFDARGARFLGADEAPGYWTGILFRSGTNRLVQVTVSGAGEPSGGALYLSPGSRLSVTASQIDASAGAGIYASRRAVLNPDAAQANQFRGDAATVVFY